MTWVKFEDRFPWHRKVRGLSDSAFRLHVSAVCWSVEHLTDGKVMRSELHLLSDVKRPTTAAKELTTAGLWDENDDRTGWELHDFLIYNEERSVVLARREADAERKRQARAARPSPAGSPDDGSSVRPDSGRTPSGQDAGLQAESRVESGSTDPARPEPSEKTRPAELSGTALTLVPAPDPFDEFWSVWPRKVAKAPARKAYARALKKAKARDLLAAAARYRDDPIRSSRPIDYTLHAATWLNEERWEDEAPTARPAWDNFVPVNLL